jgi:dTDP-4-amino-4,6-dideoxygalactose transaminase
MAAIFLALKEGDEVIMPSYTFVSTANAVVLRGATPVFVDIRLDTLNINEKLIPAAITPLPYSARISIMVGGPIAPLFESPISGLKVFSEITANNFSVEL